MFACFHLKDFMLLECYVLRKLVLENLSCWKMLVNDIFYTFEGFMSLRDFNFTKLVNFSCEHIQDKQYSQAEILNVSLTCGVLKPYL